jgi:hypothetical protein
LIGSNLHRYHPCVFVNWVNEQPLSTLLTCLGDGHDGIWNIYAYIGTTAQRREILGRYHLVENLGKMGGSQQRLSLVEACLWQGDIEGAIAQLEGWQHERVTIFISYLNKHRQQIVNDAYYQAEGLSIGSGTIKSTVKQIGRQIKIRHNA